MKKVAKNKVAVQVDVSGLDEAIEKANRLLELLREASNIVRSLSEGSKS